MTAQRLPVVGMNKAVFLDRDGTLNLDTGYPKPEDLQLLPSVPEALKLLRDRGYLLILVTNQSGIGRGMLTLAEFWEFNDKLQSSLELKFDDIMFCPHAPWHNCLCRKPSPYLIEQAVVRYAVDKRSSWVIGDSKRDIEAGYRAGLRTALVLTGKTKEEDVRLWRVKPHLIGTSLIEVVRAILDGS